MIDNIEDFINIYSENIKKYDWILNSLGKIRTKENNLCLLNSICKDKYGLNLSNNDISQFQNILNLSPIFTNNIISITDMFMLNTILVPIRKKLLKLCRIE